MNKTFLEHLEDLRWVIIKSVIAVAITMTACTFAIRPIIHFLQAPLEKALESRGVHADQFLVTFGVTDSFNLMFKIGFFAGFITALPFIFYFVAQFLLPALGQKERKMLLPIFFVGALLFFTGAIFCYGVVLPEVIRFLLDLNDWFGWKAVWTIQNYLNFVLQMAAGFGIAFELPLALLILARLGIVDAKMLGKYRRHAIVAIIIVSACITPTSDIYNLALLAVPMYVLFEASVVGARWVGKKKDFRQN